MFASVNLEMDQILQLLKWKMDQNDILLTKYYFTCFHTNDY